VKGELVEGGVKEKSVKGELHLNIIVLDYKSK
jgi:hypothetical protein